MTSRPATSAFVRILTACVLAFSAALLSLAPVAAQQTPQALPQKQQTVPVTGRWSLLWEGARDNYTGTLEIALKTGNVYKAKLTLIKSDGTKVMEDADVTVTGNEVRIERSHPSVTPWNPDRFYVVRKGNRMEGYSLDTAGQRGRKIVFTKT